ncbi:MAG: arginine repressor [Gammaproteobacteria bacterium]
MTLDETILDLVEAREITDQLAFLDLLTRAAHPITQPTLSRHLKKLGIQKVAGRYQRLEPPPAELPAFTLTQVLPNLLVIRTRPGFAQPLAVRLDQQKLEGVAGTLAGDDTVFIAVTPPSRLNTIAETVETLLSAPVTG